MDGWPAAKDLHVSSIVEDLQVDTINRRDSAEKSSFMVMVSSGSVWLLVARLCCENV
jgi:hypothetical protein